MLDKQLGSLGQDPIMEKLISLEAKIDLLIEKDEEVHSEVEDKEYDK